MTIDFLKKHVEELQKVARLTSERAAQDPHDFWTGVAAANQRQAALDARLQLAKADEASELDSVMQTESFEETISGVVSGIFETGRLDIQTVKGRLRVRFAIEQTPEVQHLAIATPTVLKVHTTRYTNPVTHKEIYKRQLLARVSPALIQE